MNEDSYLDASYEDQYDDPFYGDQDLEEEDYWSLRDFEDDVDDDFPLYLEYPDENMEDIEPPF